MCGVECRVKMDDDGERMMVKEKEDTGGDAKDPFQTSRLSHIPNRQSWVLTSAFGFAKNDSCQE